MPVDFHGTSLPLSAPHDPDPAYNQWGLVIATPNRLPKTWLAYRAGLLSWAAAVEDLYSTDDVLYE